MDDQLLQAQLAEIDRLCNAAGVKPSRLAKLAGLSPGAVNKKKRGTVHGPFKEPTMQRLRAAAGAPVEAPPSRDQIITRLRATDARMARAVEDVIALLIERRVIAESDLDPELAAALHERQQLRQAI